MGNNADDQYSSNSSRMQSECVCPTKNNRIEKICLYKRTNLSIIRAPFGERPLCGSAL